MENNNSNIINEVETEDFDLKKHLLSALLGSLYYLFIYIPFILPFKVWGKAATRISLLWEEKSIMYNENKSNHPLFLFYFNYVTNFVFDAAMFLLWPLGFIFATYTFISMYEYTSFIEGYVLQLLTFYISVLVVKLQKEILFFVVNNLLSWLFNVIRNIGKLIKNVWLLNFVYRNKTN
ncbi:hypothetical protein N9484_09010 [Polaribacter sp.]|jgi:hypothetical protein|nr:hypothetical protein [Polaribacter sp.]